MPAAESTLAPNPLEESLAKITGKSALSKSAGTSSPIGYSDQGFRQPEADVINISGSPGLGATWAEQQAAASSAANLALQQAQFGYQQTQDVISNLLKEQEAQRAAEQLGLTKQTTAQQLATAQQQMQSEAQRMTQTGQQMGIAKTAEARAAQQAALETEVKRQQMALAMAAEKREADKAAMQYGVFGNYETLRQAMLSAGREAQATGYAPVGSPTVTNYRTATQPGYNPSYAERLNAQQLGVNYNAPAFYDPSTNRTYTSPISGAPALGGQRYYDMGSGKWVNT